MVQNNQKDRQSSSKFINEKPKKKSLNLQRGLMKLGHPAGCNSKKGNSSGKKERDNKNQTRKRSYKPSTKKE